MHIMRSIERSPWHAREIIEAVRVERDNQRGRERGKEIERVDTKRYVQARDCNGNKIKKKEGGKTRENERIGW